MELSSPQQEAAYGKWLDQISMREEARPARIHGAAGLMPVAMERPVELVDQQLAVLGDDITIACDADGVPA